VDLRDWARAEAWAVDPPLPGEDVVAHNGVAIAPAHLAEAGNRLIQALAEFHEQSPDQPGIDTDRARRMVAPSMPRAGWALVVAQQSDAGRVALRGSMMALPAHDAQLSLLDEPIAQAALPHIVAGGLDPPWLRGIAHAAGEPEAAVRGTLVRMARRGELHQVVPDLFYSHAVMSELAQAVRELVAQHGAVSAAQLRDRTGLRRKRAVQVLEYFDRIGLLHRVGDAHKLRPGAAAFT
jgi:selenocysteine-specific elongation factor